MLLLSDSVPLNDEAWERKSASNHLPSLRMRSRGHGVTRHLGNLLCSVIELLLVGHRISICDLIFGASY